MTLPNELIQEFVKVTKDEVEVKNETVVYGTIVEYEEKKYVQIDGSDLYTPISSTAEVEVGERVTVMIKDHTAVVTGNISSPAARKDSVLEIGNKITEVELLVADKVSTKVFDAQVGRIDELTSDNVLIKEKLTATEASIDTLETDNATIKETLTAHEANIESLETHKLSATDADLKYAEIKELEATNATIRTLTSDYGDFKVLTTQNLEAVNAAIEDLDVENLDARYANIDFSNIGKAAMEYFYAESGLIKDVTVGDETITGELIGVTIKGDLIEGSTLKADKLVILGEDGLYYKLNVDALGETTASSDEKYQNGLDGSVIIAKSITAEKVKVTDLVAFGATVGGFKIGTKSIHSGVKESVDNTTQGIYLDSDGQMAIGDSNNFIKYYNDNGTWKLEVSAQSIKFGGTNTSVEDAINELKDEITTLLRIESSRGTVFKNDTVATVLSVVIYHGTQRITDSAGMKAAFGNSAYLQWKWQHLDDNSFGVISTSDSRFGDNGFTFTLSPEDVDTKVTFMCELIV